MEVILYSIFETCYGQVASFFERGIRKTARLLQAFSAAGRGIVALPLNIKGTSAKMEKSKVEQQKRHGGRRIGTKKADPPLTPSPA